MRPRADYTHKLESCVDKTRFPNFVYWKTSCNADNNEDNWSPSGSFDIEGEKYQFRAIPGLIALYLTKVSTINSTVNSCEFYEAG